MQSSTPIVLSPATPSELLSYIIAYQRYPTTILIGWPKQTFVEALVQDVKQQLQQQQDEDEVEEQDDDDNPIEEKKPSKAKDPPLHPLQIPTLFQEAVSRHIRLLFVPTVTHLRAYLGTFSASNSKIPAPPDYVPPEPTTSAGGDKPSTSSRRSKYPTPLLLVYGFLELHRDGREWSAQGIGSTAAYLIEAAARNSFRAAIAEPRGALGYEVLDEFLNENVPVLTGTQIKEDGSWSGRSSAIRGVLNRWFMFEDPGER